MITVLPDRRYEKPASPDQFVEIACRFQARHDAMKNEPHAIWPMLETVGRLYGNFGEANGARRPSRMAVELAVAVAAEASMDRSAGQTRREYREMVLAMWAAAMTMCMQAALHGLEGSEWQGP